MAKRPELRFNSAGQLARAANAAAIQKRPTAPPGTVPLSHQRPHPAAPPYPQHIAAVQAPQRRRGFGPGQMVLAGAAAALLAAALVGVLWLIVGQDRGQREDTSASGSTTPTTETSVDRATTRPTPTTSEPRISSIPGTDGQGFTAYQGARCDPGNEPAVMARTAQSVLVVCQAGPGSFYYRGVRLSDGAGIELANAVRSSSGFDVTNPTDGTRYQINRTALTIVQPDGRVFSEPMLEYASR